MKKGALFVILVVFAAGVGFWIHKAYQPQQESIPDPLIIGTSADYKPLSFYKNNHIVGFDIDLIHEVANRLGVKYDIRDMPFDMLLTQLQGNTIHLVAAGMSKTPERAKVVYFSDPYISEDPLIVVTKPDQQNAIQQFSDLYYQTVVVNQGYTAEAYMDSFENITLLRLPNVAEALTALEAGHAQAFVTAAHAMHPVIQERGADNFHTFAINNTSEAISLAISREYPTLRDEINTILKKLEHEGFIANLKEKWGIT